MKILLALAACLSSDEKPGTAPAASSQATQADQAASTYSEAAAQKPAATATNAPKKLTGEQVVEKVKTAELIQRVESGFGQFLDELLNNPKIQENSELVATLEKIKDLLEQNKAFALRNAVDFQAQHKKGTPPTDTRHFTYALLPFDGEQKGNINAAFNILSRTMYINKNYDPNNDYDNLILLHEFVHALEDTESRQNPSDTNSPMALQRKIAKNNIILQVEASAFAVELEVLDVLTNGSIAKVAETKMQPDFDKIVADLNMRQEQKPFLIEAYSLGYTYFRLGKDKNAMNYLGGINKTYTKLGFTCHSLQANGKLHTLSQQ